MRAGDTFLLPTGGGEIDFHCWVVVSDPSIDAERVLIVSFTTWRAEKDQACVVDVGDHPFIRHRTCVAYGSAKVVSLASLHTLKDAGLLQLQPPAPAGLLARIRTAAGESRSMSVEHADVLITQGFLDA